MTLKLSRVALAVCATGMWSGQALAQDAPAPKEAPPAAAPPAPTPPAAAEPAPKAAQDQLPAIDVVQQKQKEKQKQVKKAAPKKQVAKKAPPPPPPPAATPAPAAPAEPVDAPAAAGPPPAPGTGGIASGTVNMSPMAGSDLPIEKVPGSVGRTNSDDIARGHDSSIQQTLQATVPGVYLNDSQGNAFEGGVQFRGFESSPINGAAQGIAVYQNGVRINEVFGDVVNWSFIPSNAIDSMTVLGSNPVYGLNAIGGAIGINMRDGFNFEGVEFDTRFGSYGRIQGGAAAGMRSGNWAMFGAIEGIKDDGYRDFSESEIKRLYADLGYRTDQAEFHLNFTGAKNEVGVTAAAPYELLDLDWERTFTSPQINESEMAMVSLNGAVKVSPSMRVSGLAYYRRFKQEKIDGNILDAASAGEVTPDCDNAANICVEEGGEFEPLVRINPATGFLQEVERGDFAGTNQIFGVIDRVNQDNESYGGSVQAVDRSRLFGFTNQFLIGASWDHGNVQYNTSSELGLFKPKFVVDGAGIILDGDDFFARDIQTQSDYFGAYFSNTIDLTDRLALTVGGRYNYARLELDNNSAPGEEEVPDPDEEEYVDKLTGTHKFVRFNPNVGLAYQVHNGLTLFGGYSEANRAPTAAELSCADPEAPCLIESLLVADPPLEQVVSRTFEIGLRGKIMNLGQSAGLAWSLTGFHTRNEDDILSIAAEQSGRGFFDNIGETQRRGIEAAVQYRNRTLQTYAAYSYVDATFRESLAIASPDNPALEGQPCPETDPVLEANCAFVSPGDRLPGIPRHRFKVGFDYWITSKWKIGADAVAVSDQIFFGDEGNDNAPLAGYAKLNLHTSYDITDNIQIYGLVDNVFDARYGLFGTYFNVESANKAAAADPSLGDAFFDEDNAKTRVPGPPITAYGGVKVRF